MFDCDNNNPCGPARVNNFTLDVLEEFSGLINPTLGGKYIGPIPALTAPGLLLTAFHFLILSSRLSGKFPNGSISIIPNVAD